MIATKVAGILAGIINLIVGAKITITMPHIGQFKLGALVIS